VVRDEATGQPIADPQSRTVTAFPQLTRTDRRFYEGLLSPTKTTFTTHTYDTFGVLSACPPTILELRAASFSKN
jgi:hypothetical protein